MSDKKIIHHYKVLNQITDNSRFSTYQVEKDKKQYFLKCAKDGLERNLANDVWWSLTLNRIVEGKPKIGVRAPNVVEYHSDWAVFEWIDGKELASPSSSNEAFQAQIPYLSELLFQLDSVLQVSIDNNPFVEKSESAPYTLLNTKWPQWTELPLKQGFISQSDVDNANLLVSEWSKYVQAGLAHGDFSPWHILVNQNEKVLIDGDHSSLIKPRYYDLAYIYSRLYSRNSAKQETAELLQSFMDKSGVQKDDFAKSFIPVLTSRAIGVCNDASRDLESGHDYRKVSAELLQLCLKKDISVLI